jgi:acyl dehydratase
LPARVLVDRSRVHSSGGSFRPTIGRIADVKLGSTVVAWKRIATLRAGSQRLVFQSGQEFTRLTAITDEDARSAALLSEDVQPVHLDPVYAARTRFRRPIVPGALTIGRVAGLLGTGLVDTRTHYVVTQRFMAEFLRPVEVGDELWMRATVREWDEQAGRLSVDIEVRNQRNRRVLTGTASLVVFALTDTDAAADAHESGVASSGDRQRRSPAEPR